MRHSDFGVQLRMTVANSTHRVDCCPEGAPAKELNGQDAHDCQHGCAPTTRVSAPSFSAVQAIAHKAGAGMTQRPAMLQHVII